MKARNPLTGRSFAGTPIAKSGIKPIPRIGSPSGKFAGTGVNRKTAQKPEFTRSASSSAQNYTKQAEQYTKQAPEPFRNPQPSANPDPLAPQETGGGGAYPTFKGSRVSVSDGNNESPLAKPARAGTASGGYPGSNISAAGISGSRGRGSEAGKVAGPKQPRKVGPAQFPSGSKKPSFYGR